MGREQFRRLSESIGGSASREGDIKNRYVGDAVDAGVSESSDLYDNDSDSVEFLEFLTLALEGGSGKAVRIVIKLVDESGSRIARFYGNPQNFPIQFDPPVQMPAGSKLRYEIDNSDSSDVLVYINAVVRQ